MMQSWSRFSSNCLQRTSLSCNPNIAVAFFRLRLAPILPRPLLALPWAMSSATRLQPDPSGEQFAASHNPFAAQLGYLLMERRCSIDPTFQSRAITDGLKCKLAKQCSAQSNDFRCTASDGDDLYADCTTGSRPQFRFGPSLRFIRWRDSDRVGHARRHDSH